MEAGDGFYARIYGATDFRLVLRVGRKVAVIGITYEKFLEAEGVQGFGQVRREGDDAMNGLRDVNGAAHFVGDFSERRRGLSGRSRCNRGDGG